MVIASLPYRRAATLAFLMALVSGLSRNQATADDQIIKKDGTTISGRIAGVSGGEVAVESRSSNGGVVKGLYYITDIKTINMATPVEVTKAEAPGVPPTAVVTTLEPLVKQFAGLPVDWVVEAMAQLAEAYAAQGKADQAQATYNQIIQAYPGSAYENVAKAGRAEMSLKAGKIDEALAGVQPMVDRANKDIAPSPADGALYARAFLVYGKVLEAQKKPQQALEAYLTVKTMFYQNPNLVNEAGRLADNLRTQNPGLGIE